VEVPVWVVVVEKEAALVQVADDVALHVRLAVGVGDH